MKKANGNVKANNRTKPTSAMSKASVGSYSAAAEKKTRSIIKPIMTEPRNDVKPNASLHSISLSKSVKDINRLISNNKMAQSSNYLPVKKIFPNQSTKEITIHKSSNSLIFSKIGMTRVNSLRPFPKVDPEFYNDNQNYFWNKELQRTNTEKNILNRSQSGRFLERNFSTFQKVRIILIFL